MTKRASRRKPGPTRLPLTQARAHLGEIIRRVKVDKEQFVLERGGVPVAALIDLDEFEDFLELHDPGVDRAIKESRADYLAGRTRPAGELLAEIRENCPEEGRRTDPKARRKVG